MKKFLLSALFQVLIFFCFGQTDTSFWFAAPKISSDHGYNNPIKLKIASYQQPCTITISQPANGGMPTQTFSIAANTFQSVDLTFWLSSIECAPGNEVQNKGIKITSTNKISVYYEVNGNGPNPEMFALKGKNANGNKFYISSQYLLNNTSSYNPLPYSSFNIVATEDNCVVTITPTANIIGHAANISFQINLNKGQTYAAIASSQSAAQHLQGSLVTSTKPIAITLADDLLFGDVYGGVCSDLAGDQTVPVDLTGNEYIAFKSNLNSPYDKLYITATENATNVFQDGILITSLNTGQSFELTVSNSSTYIKTSAPVYAYELSGVGCEVGSAILPKLNCTGSSAVSVARSTTEAFTFTLLVKAGAQNNFLLNNTAGIITGAQFNLVPGTSGLYYYAKIDLPLSNYPNETIITVSNSTDVFQMGVLQGGVLSGASFGYFSDFNTLKATASTSNLNPCRGNNVTLLAETVSSGTYSWTGPNNFISTQQNPMITNIPSANSGKYILKVSVPGCGIYSDTVSLKILPTSTSVINQSICNGQSFLGYSSTGTYIDTLVATNGCDSIRTINLIVKSKLTSIINKTICSGQSYSGHSTSGTFTDTFIAANGCDSIRTLNLTIKSNLPTNVAQTICQGQTYLGYNKNGVYTDSFITSNGCDSVRILNLTVQNQPNPNLGPDITICTFETLKLLPGMFDTYLWQDGSSLNNFTVTNAGLYSVSVTNTCGSANDEILITEKSCEIFFPNTFTPNNDQKNDVFKILNGSEVSNFYLAIFDRWGQKVFETTDYFKGWDGNINNKPADAGAYVWYCNFIGFTKLKKMRGSVLLLR